MRARDLAALALAAGCDLSAPAPYDGGRFDVREATVAPRDDAALDDLATVDASLVDVTVADVVAAADVSRDAGAVDAPARCVTVANDHAAAVREAQRCLRDEDCDALVCETLCCACEVYVSRRNREVELALALVTQAADAGCTGLLPCPRVPCARPTRAVCSSEGRCVTLREDPSDAAVPAGPDAMP